MSDLKARVNMLQSNCSKIIESLKVDKKRIRIAELEGEAAESGFWDKDQQKARAVMQKIGDLKKEVEEAVRVQGEIDLLKELSDTGETLKTKDVVRLEKELNKLKLDTFLSGKHDKKNTIVSIHAGQGGTEAMDWTSMLYRMYLKFAEKRKWKTETIDITSGEEAGIKSVIFQVSGNFAYGYLKGEAGTHRLVRQSPFNADKLRQTSFALVEVMPEFEKVDLPDISLADDDLDWQFFRSSGKGGQNVNKVSTAVRLIHKPTGIVVTAQTQRSQTQNRESALNLLRAKLWLLEKAKAQGERKALKGEYRPASWGTQIRSYVLHPYKMVKDLRTNVEVNDPQKVLDGDLDKFIEAELKLTKIVK